MTENTQVLKEFEALSAVPRRSFYNEKIINYCINWAIENGFDYYHDIENGNVIIRKPATPGMEERPTVVLQGHLDMVAVTDPGVEHDWDNDGIEIIRDGEFYTANGTTLGADDGMAAALAFALLKDKSAVHPDLEVLLTTDEEVGMLSVKNADLTCLQGKYMLNLDSGMEGNFTVGCAGGSLVRAVIPANREKTTQDAYKITISGLKGGHSGIEIVNGRANALKLMGRLLSKINKAGEYRISSLTAEGKDNAIQDNAECVIVTDVPFETLTEIAASFEVNLKHMFRVTDPDIKVVIERSTAYDALSTKASYSLQSLLQFMPYGPLAYDQVKEGVIETSANIGPVLTDEKGIGIFSSVRSSVAERKAAIVSKIEDLCALVGAEFIEEGKSYPAWLPDYDSDLLALVKKVYFDMYGKEATVMTTHGGLECGYIMANSNIEATVALGPDVYYEHTTEEKINIQSLLRTYDFIKAVLAAI